MGVETGTQTAAGKSSGTLPVPHHVGVVQHDGMAQQGLQVGDGPLQRPGRRGQAIVRQSPARPQLQLAGGVVEQVERGRLAVDRLGAAAEHGLQAGGQVLGLLGVRHQGDAGRQLGLALPEGVPRLEQFAQHAGQRGGQRLGLLRRHAWLGLAVGGRGGRCRGDGPPCFRPAGDPPAADTAASSGSSLSCPRVAPTPGLTGADQLRLVSCLHVFLEWNDPSSCLHVFLEWSDPSSRNSGAAPLT